MPYYVMSCCTKLCPVMLCSSHNYVTSVCRICYVSLSSIDHKHHIVFILKCKSLY